MLKKEKYVKIFNRPLFLMICQSFDLGERVRMKKLSPAVYFMDPIFEYVSGKGTNFYYNFSDPRQDPEIILSFFSKHRKKFLELKEEFFKDCDALKKLIKNKDSRNFIKIFNLTSKIRTLMAIGNILSNEKGKSIRSKDVIEISKEMRAYSDSLTHESELETARILRNILPNKYKKYYKYLTFEEVKNKNFPKMIEIKKRSEKFIFHRGVLYAGIALEEYAKKRNYDVGPRNDSKKDKKLKGKIAFGGRVKGVAKIVLEMDDIDKVKKGNVMISPMTTANFMPAMKKAAAFVTDEGGVTCHASIVAREMGKPCIIGTKIATQVLKDGDEVEVDANEGVVKILKSNI